MRATRAACASPSRIDEAEAFAKQMLGATLVTLQTGEAGKQVNRLYIEDGAAIDKEFYLSMLIDRATSRVAFVVSTEGGMDIEEVAHDTPEKIVTFSVDPATGLMPHHGRHIADALGLKGDLAKQAGRSGRKALCGLHRQGHGAARDQSADRHQGRQAALPRRQNVLRRQCALPPSRHRRAARQERGGREGDRGVETRPRLYLARRQYRLHGQWRRPRHGDDGHHQALWRVSRRTSSMSAAAPRRRR